MNEPVENWRAEKDGEEYQIVITPMDDIVEPVDRLSKMYYKHNRYDLGNDIDLDDDDCDCWGCVKDRLDEKYSIFVIKPVYLLDHSGLRISTEHFSSNWDSGQVGFVFVTYEDAKWFLGLDTDEEVYQQRDKIEEILENDVDRLDDRLTGNVYEYVVYKLNKCSHCGSVTREVEDSCGGFYGTEWEENGLFDDLDDVFIEQRDETRASHMV